MLRSNVSSTEFDPVDTWACYSSDGRDLISDWSRDKASRKAKHRYVESKRQLSQVGDDTEYLLGIFANGHLPMDYARNKGPEGQPSLQEMTVAALRVLAKSENGYFLAVEGGLIDYAHHRGHAAQALQETVCFSDAIEAALGMVDLKDTLVIVTSDHAHSMTIAGYADRGASILGIAQKAIDGTPYTTLLYATGGKNNDAHTVNKTRDDPSVHDTTDFSYSQQALVITDEAYHGGGDVIIYAAGPYAHLFHSVHEQNYAAEVVAFAAKLEKYSGGSPTSSSIRPLLFATILLLLRI